MWTVFFFFILAVDARKICKVDEIRSSEWVFQFNQQSVVNHPYGGKSFICCGWDSQDWRDPEIRAECGDEKLRDDRFIGSIDFHARLGGHGCACDELQKTRRVVSEREKWLWRTHSCRMLSWNATQFCSLLNGRRILLIGDSTMAQTAGTLANMIHTGINSTNLSIPLDLRLCNKNILFHRINTIDDAKVQIQRYNYPELVIFGVGPHYHAIDHFQDHFRIFLNHLSEMRNEIMSQNKSNVKFIWKTINPPHMHCHNFSNPIKHPIPIVHNDSYHWALFPTYDEIARNSSIVHEYDILDMYPLSLRPDAHPGRMAWQWAKSGGDCLHFCLPGPLNIFSLILLHYLYHEKR